MDGMTAERTSTYVLVDVATHATASLRMRPLDQLTERHIVPLDVKQDFTTGQDLMSLLSRGDVRGAIFVLEHGAPGRTLLRQCGDLLNENVNLYFYWPSEQAIEVLDRERLASFWRLWLVTRFYSRYRAWRDRPRHATGSSRAAAIVKQPPVGGITPVDTSALAAQIGQISAETKSLLAHNQGATATLRELGARYASNSGEVVAREMTGVADYIESGLPALERISNHAQQAVASIQSLATEASATKLSFDAMPPVPHRTWAVEAAQQEVHSLVASAAPNEIALAHTPSPRTRLDTTGMYLRLDFWAPLTSGGSYGHTVYQAKALSRTMHDFVCVVANPFRTLDAVGVRQVILQPERREGNETNIVDANRYYYDHLKPLIEAVRPAFIFERLVLGNYVGAKICKELGIPYIAEYNGSEISMMRSFNKGKGYEHEDFYLAAEEFSFKQATLISVVSEHVGNDVLKRGVAPQRILINPNAVELEAYSPGTPDERRAIRAELGFDDSHRVIGFIGTFGGWHGVDVLAESMPKILNRAPSARFLLIGDGNLKGMVREAIEKHNLHGQVVDSGRVPQTEGARLLKACDVLVSPHSSHMVDSKFFGSPTKLFEYMAMSAGIVASDLEQIGEVLAPALRLEDVRSDCTDAGANRALLCAPGDVQEFVEATLTLVNDPKLSAALGKNARAAAEEYYTWDQHVADLWAVLSGTERRGFHADLAEKGIEKAI